MSAVNKTNQVVVDPQDFYDTNKVFMVLLRLGWIRTDLSLY